MHLLFASQRSPFSRRLIYISVYFFLFFFFPHISLWLSFDIYYYYFGFSFSLTDIEGVEIHERDEEWVRAKGMGLFHGVSKGSSEPMRFLEVIFLNPNSVSGACPLRFY